MSPEDRAQALELEDYERNQARAIQPASALLSAEWCGSACCGERIPDARREAVPGVQLCVGCQELIEKTRGRL